MAVAPAIRETVSAVAAGHLDSSPDAHAVGTELDQIRQRSKRLGRAIGVQGADLMEANPWTGPAWGNISGACAAMPSAPASDCSWKGVPRVGAMPKLG